MNRILVSVLSECEQAELLRMLNLVVDADESLRKSAPSPTLPRERVRERRALKAG